MSYLTIRYTVESKIATVTLHRPDKLNAFNFEMMNELIDVFGKIDSDDEVRAVIVTGEGRAFCAGSDLGAGTSTFAQYPLGGPFRADGSIDYSHESARDGGGE